MIRKAKIKVDLYEVYEEDYSRVVKINGKQVEDMKSFYGKPIKRTRICKEYSFGRLIAISTFKKDGCTFSIDWKIKPLT